MSDAKVWIGLTPELFSAIQPHAQKMGVTAEEWSSYMLRRCISALEAEKKKPLTSLPEPKVLNWRRDRTHNG